MHCWSLCQVNHKHIKHVQLSSHNTHTHTHILTCTHNYIHTYTYLHICAHVYTHMHARTRTHSCIHTQHTLHTHACTHAHTHAHTHTTYMHTHMHARHAPIPFQIEEVVEAVFNGVPKKHHINCGFSVVIYQSSTGKRETFNLLAEVKEGCGLRGVV